MSQDEVREILAKQLQLLSEVSQKASDKDDADNLARLSEAMAMIANSYLVNYGVGYTETLDGLEKRVATIERRLEEANKNLGQLLDCWTTVLLQFIEDFRISTPEIDQIVEELKRKEKLIRHIIRKETHRTGEDFNNMKQRYKKR